ncbi:MAG: hypothetical protein ACR5LC_03330 [Symbiopectobacterium sp.]|uniref:hypothetical protein n=1 Tax=Symbiopectobacterium sp. TaxID=2952789 RepID=UPI003F2E9711
MIKTKLAAAAYTLCLADALSTSFNAAAEAGKTWITVRIATEGAYHPYNFIKPDGTSGWHGN